MGHRNIPIFIPHLGCPHQCVFCNQRSISGCRGFDPSGVDGQIQRALSTIPAGEEVEIAFFGGSFTGIDPALMLQLLTTAQRYVDAGAVASIRLSTRPDYISEEILERLSAFSVRHVELGIQSMNTAVLEASYRGHTADASREACRDVVAAGFSLTGQMMIGLPASTPASELATAEEICALGATSARIYPTVVFQDTPLAEQYRRGEYRPLSVAEAVERSARVLEVFLRHGVECLRIGLCAGEDLLDPQKVCAGPNHPALGELVWNEYYYHHIYELLKTSGLGGKNVALRIPRALISKVVGQHRCNLQRLNASTGTAVKKILPAGEEEGIAFCPW